MSPSKIERTMSNSRGKASVHQEGDTIINPDGELSVMNVNGVGECTVVTDVFDKDKGIMGFFSKEKTGKMARMKTVFPGSPEEVVELPYDQRVQLIRRKTYNIKDRNGQISETYDVVAQYVDANSKK